MADVRWAQLSSRVSPSFWPCLAALKLNELRLETTRSIRGYLAAGRLEVRASSLDAASRDVGESEDGEMVVPGSLCVHNMIEAFRAPLHRTATLREHAERAWRSLHGGDLCEAAQSAARFHLSIFADLKAHHFHYWFAFPALVAVSAALDGTPPHPAVAHDLVSLSSPRLAARLCAAADAQAEWWRPSTARAYASFLGAFAACGRADGRGESPLSLCVASRPPRDATAGAAVPLFRTLSAWLSAERGRRLPRDALRDALFVLVDQPPLAAAAAAESEGAPSGAVTAGWIARNLVLVLAAALQRAGVSHGEEAAEASAAAGAPSPLSTNADDEVLICLLRPAPLAWRAAFDAAAGAEKCGAGADGGGDGGGIGAVSSLAFSRDASLVLRVPLARFERLRSLLPPPLEATPAESDGGGGGGAAAAAGKDASAAATAIAALPTPALPPPLPAGFCCLGFELNTRSLPGPRLADLSASMAPGDLSDAAAALNLRLMRWRQLPALRIEALARARVLLLGAGTLGCHVARDLLAWGLRHITLVDGARVGFSNPVRQPLFEFADAAAGRWKAEAAAEALRRIHPGVVAEGLVFAIPMPGHGARSLAEREEACRAAARLERLIGEHDAVFLLTDTRESRWLPSLLARAHRTPALTVALGFDSYLVMRHGLAERAERSGGSASGTSASAQAFSWEGLGERVLAPAACLLGAIDSPPPPSPPLSPAPERLDAAESRSAPSAESRSAPSAAPAASIAAEAVPLCCYFCMDVVSPTISTLNKTLDQQCTVTRPGAAPIASALAVELLIALLHHPAGAAAPADAAAPLTAATASPLGLVPHQIRGFLSHIVPLLCAVPAFAHCPACSPAVLAALRSHGSSFLLDALAGTDTCGAAGPLGAPAPLGGGGAAAGGSILDRVTGLGELRRSAEEALRRGEAECSAAGGDLEEWLTGAEAE